MTQRNPEALTDVALLRLYHDGEESAAAELHRRYAGRLLRVIKSHLSSIPQTIIDPEDVVQSAFRRLFLEARKDAPLGESGDIYNWLAVVALNRLRDLRDSSQAACRDHRRTHHDPIDELAQLRADDGVLALVVKESLERLPDALRRVAELRLAGFEVGEIAEKIGRSQRTVERTLHECRKALLAAEGDAP